MMSSQSLSVPSVMLTGASQHSEYSSMSFGESSHNNSSEDSSTTTPNDADYVNSRENVTQNRYVAPSKVVHLRNLPHDVSETDIVTLGSSFGVVSNVLILRGKYQAFLEMSNKQHAGKVVAACLNERPTIRGRVIYAQYSIHRELKRDQNNLYNVSSDCHLHQSYSGSSSSSLGGNCCGTTSNSNGSTDTSSVSLDQSPSTSAACSSSGNGRRATSSSNNDSNTVLRVIVERLLYPVSLETFYQIFNRFGQVVKIVLFTKNNTFQALIEFAEVAAAQCAQLSLDGQNIYNGCCTLRIEFSKLSTLIVKYNNSKSRDFTNSALPPGDTGADIIQTQVGLVNANNLLLLSGRQPPTLFNLNGTNNNVSNVATNINTNGGGDRFVNLFGVQNQLAAGPPLALGIETPLTPPVYGNTFGNLSSFPFANLNPLQTGMPSASYGLTNVLFAVNLSEEFCTPYALFVFFGAYGDVQRVKILYNRRDSALIQMKEPHQSYLAIFHLDRLRLFGKTIRVMSSKHQSIQMPREGQPDAGLTRDYSRNQLHRFKKPFSKNYHNIYPPSSILHLSNIPLTCTEADITGAFIANNFDVKAFKFFPNDHKMALLELGTVEEAVLALIRMHNHELSESSHLRVSFAKSRSIQITTEQSTFALRANSRFI